MASVDDESENFFILDGIQTFEPQETLQNPPRTDKISYPLSNVPSGGPIFKKALSSYEIPLQNTSYLNGNEGLLPNSPANFILQRKISNLEFTSYTNNTNQMVNGSEVERSNSPVNFVEVKFEEPNIDSDFASAISENTKIVNDCEVERSNSPVNFIDVQYDEEPDTDSDFVPTTSRNSANEIQNDKDRDRSISPVNFIEVDPTNTTSFDDEPPITTTTSTTTTTTTAAAQSSVTKTTTVQPSDFVLVNASGSKNVFKLVRKSELKTNSCASEVVDGKKDISVQSLINMMDKKEASRMMNILAASSDALPKTMNNVAISSNTLPKTMNNVLPKIMSNTLPKIGNVKDTLISMSNTMKKIDTPVITLTNMNASPKYTFPKAMKNTRETTNTIQGRESCVSSLRDLKNISSLNSNYKQPYEGFEGFTSGKVATQASTQDSDIAILQEEDPKAKLRKMVAHIVHDSDSDICVVDDDSDNQKRQERRVSGKKRGRKRKLNSHLPFLSKNKYFKCSECDFKSLSITQLQVHEEAHPKGRKIKCSKCSFETRLKSCMIYHAAMHSGGKKFRCSKCNFKTNNLDQFLAHENRKYPCKICKVVCHLQRELEQHTLSFHLGTLTCRLCSYSTDNVSEMKDHKLSHRVAKQEGTDDSSTNSRFICTMCRYVTISMNLLRKHIKMNHSTTGYPLGIKRRKRGRRKLIVNSTREHKKEDSSSNHWKPVTYDLKLFKKKGGEYHCPKCLYVTDEEVFLETHMKTHYRKNDERIKLKEVFKCSYCDFDTEFERMMESHLTTHAEDDSDFDMDLDNSGVSDQLNLRIEIQNKKFVCSNCDFQTDLKKAYERHMSLHFRERTFNELFSTLL